MKILLANFTKMVNDSGGMAKVTCSFANEMVKRGHEVVLVYSDERSGDFYYPIDERVQCYDLRFQEGRRISFPLYLKIKRETFRLVDKKKSRTVWREFDKKYHVPYCKRIIDNERPDVIVSFNPGTSAVLICDLDTRLPIITMSHGDPADYFQFYPEDSVTAVKKSTINQVLLPSFESHILSHFPECKVVVIGNAIVQHDCVADLGVSKDTYKIVCVGRLNHNHKRQHLLISAFGKVAKDFPNWILELWGAKDSEVYFRELQAIIKKEGLEGRCFLKGTSKEIPNILRGADIFAFPSAYEGFGMALAEAMSMGLPVIGYKNCPAVNELVVSGKNGLLSEDGVDDFAKCLAILMRNKGLRMLMGKEAKISMQEYAPDVIWDKWEKLLLKFERKDK